MTTPFKRKARTALGILVIIASVVSVFVIKEMSWQGAAIGIAAGIGLMYYKPKNTGGAAVLLLLFLAGCASSPTLTTENKESYKETFKKAQAAVPGGVVTKGLSATDLNAIITALQQGKDTIIYKDRNNRAALKFYLDALGNLQTECESKDALINYLQKEIERERSVTKTVTKTKLKTPIWCWVVMGFLAATTFTFATLFQIQRFKILP